MVYCGKPSKACQRCRERKLRCDLRASGCGQCSRAKIKCTGYRDIQQLRIRNESQSVKQKACSKAGHAAQPSQALTVPIDTRARDVFFNYFVAESPKSWDFLTPFYSSKQTPVHLTLTIDAVSLAFFSHQAHSNIARAIARERYVSALHTTSEALRSPDTLAKDTTIFASLLLDLFEKITYDDLPETNTWSSHVNGALTLVNIRGLDRFQDPAGLRFLSRLTTNFVICCVSSENSVPPAVKVIRDFAGEGLGGPKTPKWLLTDTIIDYANLVYQARTGSLSSKERIYLFSELDVKLRALFNSVPPSWQYQTTIIKQPSDRVLEQHFNTYADRHVSQTWNVLRLVRIFLNESLLDCCFSEGNDHDDRDTVMLAQKFTSEIQTLAREICASVPPYLDPHGIGSGENRSPSPPKSSPSVTVNCDKPCCQSSNQRSSCYALIFPLYAAAWSRASPEYLKEWVIRQLRFIAERVGIRKAGVVAGYLEKEREQRGREREEGRKGEGKRMNPWTVYAVLGSYAFAA